MKFKLQILQWCILTGDPFPNHKLKKNPITFVIKMLMHFLFLGHVKFLLPAAFILPTDQPLKMYFSKMCGCGGILSSSPLCPWPGKPVEGCVVHDFPQTRAALEGRGFSSLSRCWTYTQGAKGLWGLLGPCPLVWKMLEQWFPLLLPVALRTSWGIKGEGISVPCSIKTPGGFRGGEEGAECSPVSHHTQDSVQPWLSKGSSFAPSLEKAGGCCELHKPSPMPLEPQRCVTSSWGSGKEWGERGTSQVCGINCARTGCTSLLALWRKQGQSFPAWCTFLPKGRKQNYH